MKRWLWIVASILISTFVYTTIRYGLRPKPIPILNATEFENAEQIGAVVYKRLRQNIRPERLLVLGSSPDLAGGEAIWSGFLKTARADQIQIGVFFQREGLPVPNDVAGWELIQFDTKMVDSGEFSRQVQERLLAGKLVVVHGLSVEVSHLNKASLSERLEAVVHHPVLAISTLGLSLKPDEIASLQEQCLRPVVGGEVVTRLDCAELRISRTIAKKHPTPGKICAVMERHGLQEYLIFVHN